MSTQSCFASSDAFSWHPSPKRSTRRPFAALVRSITIRRRPGTTRLPRAIGRLAVVVGVIGVGASLPSSASAQIVLPDFCKTALPHATLSLSGGPGSSVSATSQGGSYFYNSAPLSCRRFIVDIGVPAGQKVTLKGRYADSPSGPMVWGGLPLSQPDCAKYVQYVAVYRKTAFPFPSQYTLQAATRFKGQWIGAEPLVWPSHCRLAWDAGDPVSELEQHTTSVFAAKFRVVVAAKSTTWKQVKVTASNPPS